MSNKLTRWPCDWDVSNQNKRYTCEEVKFIQRNLKDKTLNVKQIAQRLKRGLWAIQVQISNMEMQEQHILQKTIERTPAPLSLRKAISWKQESKFDLSKTKPVQTAQYAHIRKLHKPAPDTKLCALQNRKFKTEKMIVESTNEEIENELKELLGL